MAKSKILTASFLVAGTAIGAGMLALPVATAEGGFWPAVVTYFFCWLFSACTGLLLLEACLWLPKDSNIISLSSHLLGKSGKIASWILYLFLFYCLTVAYSALGGGFISAVFGQTLPAPTAIFIFVLLFSPLVYIGTHAVDRVNFLLMFGLIFSFVLFILIGIEKVELHRLHRFDWPAAALSLPVVLISFSYQGIIPSLRNYFHGKEKHVRKVILIGSSVPFLVYVIWEYLILGVVPLEGAKGLLAAKAEGLSSVVPLKHFTSTQIYAIGQGFAFCALTTSFLGVTLGLFDFLADGLKMSKKGRKRFFLYLLVYGPPALIAMLNPQIFISALHYAGGVGSILLLGLIPILMVWSGRYRKKLSQKNPQLGGGRCVLLALILFVIFGLVIEVMNELF